MIFIGESLYNLYIYLYIFSLLPKHISCNLPLFSQNSKHKIPSSSYKHKTTSSLLKPKQLLTCCKTGNTTTHHSHCNRLTKNTMFSGWLLTAERLMVEPWLQGLSLAKPERTTRVQLHVGVGWVQYMLASRRGGSQAVQISGITD